MASIVSLYDLSRVTPYTPTGLKDVSRIKVNSKDIIGIEVEVENVLTLGNVNKVWQNKTDGSLRNHGAEFVTQPIEARFAPEALENLMKEALSSECHFSPRTSVHVHLNMQDFDGSQVLDYVLLYSVFEKLFYRYAGRGRIKNIYCVPITETSLLKNFLENGLRNEWSKYTGLNLVTLRSFGTVEFRHMHGTFDVDKLCVWISLITSLKDYIRRMPSKELRPLIQGMDDDFDFKTLLYKIFGDTADCLKYKSVEDVHDNYMAAKTAFAKGSTITTIRGALRSEAPFFKGLA